VVLKSIRRIAYAECIFVSLILFGFLITLTAEYLPIVNLLFNPHAKSGVYSIYALLAIQALILFVLLLNIPLAVKELLKSFYERTIFQVTVLLLGIILVLFLVVNFVNLIQRWH
jgi:hypothetical protein